MFDLLVAPGAPFYALALAGALLAMLGAALAPSRPLLVGPAASHLGAGGLLVAGQLAGVSVAATLLGLAIAGGAQGGARALLICGALGAYLGLGVALPRRPTARREREAAALRRLTPGFISFVRVATGSFESPLAVMRRYTRRPQARLAPMQALVAEALQVGADLRLRPFAALAAAARPRRCRELTEVAEALAQAEAEGASVEAVLAAHQETLELLLQGEFRRMVRRRSMYLLLMVAVSLVVGILLNLLFVMTGGGTVLTRVG
ncbi:MAG TPA: hypothetical protein PKD53_12020 [Chloroflexaceae bacterium]|nr:hypothetical protein [Chloroflexaceae bacterium]